MHNPSPKSENELSAEGFYARNLYRNSFLSSKDNNLWSVTRMLYSHPLTRVLCVLAMLFSHLLQYSFDDVDLYVYPIQIDCTKKSPKTVLGFNTVYDTVFGYFLTGIIAPVAPLATNYTAKVYFSIMLVETFTIVLLIAFTVFVLRTLVFNRGMRLRRSGALYLPCRDNSTLVGVPVVPMREEEVPKHLRKTWSNGLAYDAIAGVFWGFWFIGLLSVGVKWGSVGCDCGFSGGPPCTTWHGMWEWGYSTGLVITITFNVFAIFCVIDSMYQQATYYPLTVEWPCHLYILGECENYGQLVCGAPAQSALKGRSMYNRDDGISTSGQDVRNVGTGIGRCLTNVVMPGGMNGNATAKLSLTGSALFEEEDMSSYSAAIGVNLLPARSTCRGNLWRRIAAYLGRPSNIDEGGGEQVYGGTIPSISSSYWWRNIFIGFAWVSTLLTLSLCILYNMKLRNWGIKYQKYGLPSSISRESHGALYASLSILFTSFVMTQDWTAPHYQWPRLIPACLPINTTTNAAWVLWALCALTISMDARFIFQPREQITSRNERICVLVISLLSIFVILFSIMRSSLYCIKFFGPKN